MAPHPWPIKKLGDVVAGITVGHVGPMTAEYRPSGIPFLRSQNVRRLRIDPEGLCYIGEAFHAKLSKSRLKSGDVVVVRTGEPGTAAVVPDWLNDANCADLVIIRPGNSNPRFIAYFINSVTNGRIADVVVGAVQQHFNVGAARELWIPTPSRKIQDGIAEVLGALDDKIELNQRMERTLEDLAWAFFSSWFVDFEPVMAKRDGRMPVGLPAEAIDLFPSHFEESELGPIPQGWTAARVGDYFDVTMGQSPPGSTYNEMGVGLPFYQGRTDFGFRYPGRRVYCTAPTRLAQAGDTLISVRAPVGDANLAAERCAIGRGVAAVRYRDSSPSFTYYAMRSLSDEFNVYESEGTLFGAIGGDDFRRLPFVYSSPAIVKSFEELIGPMDAQIETSERESRTLAELRDTLLSPLLSGELTINSVEKVVGAAL
jgi:type I restriction enzyme S subunit